MIDLTFLDINKNKKDYKKVKELYKEVFPKEERIPIWALKSLAKKDKAKFYGIYHKENFVGLIYNIYYKDIIFIFYFAIDKNVRGQGHGGRILEAIKQKYINNRIILSIEPIDKTSNNYEQRIKRKNFYIKNGFQEANYTIREKNIIYEMLCYSKDSKQVHLEEFEEMMKNYFGKILYKYIYSSKY